jgi:predicted flavoprotein YhiN
MKEQNEYRISIDLKPALDEEKLDKRIVRDFDKFSRKQFKNSLDELLPKKLIPVIISLSGISEDKFVNQITQEERKKRC